MIRVLFYNWVDYLDEQKRGGGVTIYQRDLIRALAGESDVETTFLSAGISYDIMSSKPRWERVSHGPAENRARRFEIVNSGTLSPAHHSFGNRSQITQPETMAVFFDFLRREGPFDVVHFNNIEGIPAEVLTLKAEFPQTRVILTLHNYYPFCPQVNLWYKERENCRDFEDGQKCERCLPKRHDERIVRLANGVAFNLKRWGIRPGTRLFDRAFLPAMRLARRAVRTYARLSRRGNTSVLHPVVSPYEAVPAAAPLATMPRQMPAAPPSVAPVLVQSLSPRAMPAFRDFQTRRRAVVALINQNCDLVLGVSDRVCDVAAHFGIEPALLRTSYIGSNQAEKFTQTAAKPSILRADGTLTLGYLGYMRRDKGFFFLLEALEEMPSHMAARLRLVICAARDDADTMRRLFALRDRFAGLTYADGYAHEHLDAVLSQVDVGLVPVLWEDNLPQVAIEMHARHIPLLTSDLGGARELSNCAAMVFPAGSVKAFTARIAALLDGQITSAEYWRDATAPVSMPQHLGELRALWAGQTGALPPARPRRPLGALQKSNAGPDYHET